MLCARNIRLLMGHSFLLAFGSQFFVLWKFCRSWDHTGAKSLQCVLGLLESRPGPETGVLGRRGQWKQTDHAACICEGALLLCRAPALHPGFLPAQRQTATSSP